MKGRWLISLQHLPRVQFLSSFSIFWHSLFHSIYFNIYFITFLQYVQLALCRTNKRISDEWHEKWLRSNWYKAKRGREEVIHASPNSPTQNVVASYKYVWGLTYFNCHGRRDVIKLTELQNWVFNKLMKNGGVHNFYQQGFYPIQISLRNWKAISTKILQPEDKIYETEDILSKERELALSSPLALQNAPVNNSNSI